MIRTRSIFRATVSCSCQYHNTIRKMKFVKLSQTNDAMPTLGLGTWQAEPSVVKSTVYAALELGYRHIDTAFNYNNEEAIGSAITKWIDDGRGTRSELFITTKKLEECQKSGLIRNIGLSNFNEEQIEKIVNHATFKPQVLQVELHAYFQQIELRKFCEKHNIILTAYAPLGSPGAKNHFVTKYKYSPSTFPDLLSLPDVTTLAKKYGKTPAQILLHFLVRQNIVVIPKSTNLERLKENMDFYDFELTADEMDTLIRLDKGENGRIFNFLFWKGVEFHPEYPFESVKQKLL
ncbi:unnamed protein product [Spodoptera exigua]|nr:unnamed protein product [Spodoptera exigua]